ncbi:MAG: signal peptidase I [Pyrinomonadaceae bacterium]
MIRTLCLLTAIAFLLLAASCKSKVAFSGSSMLPSIKDGSVLLIDKDIREIQRRDVIQFKFPLEKDKYYVKRVIALPGETIEIREGAVWVNGTRIVEDYVDQTYNQVKSNYPPQVIEENEYFVMGDNRDNSSDSRSWGTVNKKLIVGRCIPSN